MGLTRKQLIEAPGVRDSVKKWFDKEPYIQCPFGVESTEECTIGSEYNCDEICTVIFGEEYAESGHYKGKRVVCPCVSFGEEYVREQVEEIWNL